MTAMLVWLAARLLWNALMAVLASASFWEMANALAVRHYCLLGPSHLVQHATDVVKAPGRAVLELGVALMFVDQLLEYGPRLLKLRQGLCRHPHPKSDGRLLLRFVRERDQAAFATLMHRHGPVPGVVNKEATYEQCWERSHTEIEKAIPLAEKLPGDPSVRICIAIITDPTIVWTLQLFDLLPISAYACWEPVFRCTSRRYYDCRWLCN
jgi:hypothetical protein